jgi:AcrR family transcriptional regulator
MNSPQATPIANGRSAPGIHRNRLSSEDRRRQLLEHAVELFARHGFSGTRTKDIAAACGVSEGILFRHFATKEDLYHAILDTHETESGEWLAEMKRLAERRDDAGFVRCLALQMMKSFREHSAFHRLMSYARLEGHTLADIFHARMGLPTFDFLRGYVADRQREGAFRSGDAGALVLCVFAPALHYALNKYVFGLDVFPLSDEDMAEELAGFILAGLRAPRKSKLKPRAGRGRNPEAGRA